MIQDLHSHTHYSYCGRDSADEIIQAAIAGGIEVFGICDHSYGIMLQHKETMLPSNDIRIQERQLCLNRYLEFQHLLKEKYAGKIEIQCGIEIPTLNIPNILLPEQIDVSKFDYCLIEHLDSEDTTEPDLFRFAERCGCENIGIAHTDLPNFLGKKGLDKSTFFRRMAEHGIFWELNVSYDSIHGFREHQYVKDFFENKELQDIIRDSGVKLSIGFDGHRVEDYLPERIQNACRKVESLNIPLVTF